MSSSTNYSIFNKAEFSADNGYLVATGIEFKDGTSMSSAPPGYKLADSTFGQDLASQSTFLGGITTYADPSTGTAYILQSGPAFRAGRTYKLQLVHTYECSGLAQDEQIVIVPVVTPESSATGAPLDSVNLPVAAYYGRQVGMNNNLVTAQFEYQITIPAATTQVYDTLKWTVYAYGNNTSVGNNPTTLSWEIKATNVWSLSS